MNYLHQVANTVGVRRTSQGAAASPRVGQSYHFSGKR